jgi:hypothetical protein
MLMTNGAFARLGPSPHRIWISSTPPSTARITGAISLGQISSRGSKFSAAVGLIIGGFNWLNSST